MDFSEVINHNAYANNYDYNKAIYLLNQDQFWDNNFVMLKEDKSLFSPLSVLNFSRYENIYEVEEFLKNNEENIQCIVAKPELGLNSENFGEAQNPGLSTYADHVGYDAVFGGDLISHGFSQIFFGQFTLADLADLADLFLN
jgi:hypothetical protein